MSIVDILTEENRIQRLHTTPSRTDITYSFFDEACNFILESQKEYNTATKYFYKAITESENDTDYILEACEDWISRIKKIIDKFIQYIKDLYKRFMAKVMQFVRSDKFIIKNKKVLSDFNSSFTYDGYVFTFDDSVPAVSVLQPYISDILELKGIDQNSSEDDIAKAAATAIKSIKYMNLQGYEDGIRAEIINSDIPITYNNYKDALFSVYRDGASMPATLTIKDNDIKNALEFFENYKDSTKQIERLQKNLESEYKSIKDQISKIGHSNISNGEYMINYPVNSVQVIKYNSDAQKLFVELIKMKSNQIQRISDMHLLAFASKIDAMNDCLVQSRNILHKALNMISVGESAEHKELLEEMALLAGFFDDEDIL